MYIYTIIYMYIVYMNSLQIHSSTQYMYISTCSVSVYMYIVYSSYLLLCIHVSHVSHVYMYHVYTYYMWC